MIWIVSGPSSSGKSTFLDSPRAQEITGLPPSTVVWFPKEIGGDGPQPGPDAFIHYNILRPLQRSPRPQDIELGPKLFEGDKQWRAILALPGEKRAVIVVADRATLMARVKARGEVEKGDAHAYGVAKWMKLYNAISVDAVYRAWRGELIRRGIHFVEIDGTRIW
jgi:hypothetical protein